MRVAIEVGHGGKDGGAIGPNNRLEKNDNLMFALILRDEFIRQGFEVTMTRTTDIFIDTSVKSKTEHSPACNIAIAIHRNGSTDPNANGFEIWVHSNAGDQIVTWAKEICSAVEKTGMKIRNGGVHKGFVTNPKGNYYWNAGTKSPSMLIELGFISNAKDNELFDTYTRHYANEIVRASCNFLGVEYVKQNPLTGADNKTKYDELIADLEALINKYK